MKLELNEKIMKETDVLGAVLFAVAEQADLWPVNVPQMVEVFPYVDERTIRNRLNALADKGICQKVKGLGKNNTHAIFFEKEETPAYS